MRIETALVILAVLAKHTLAKTESPLFGQCGGADFTGATDCVAGAICTVSNESYSQCLPDSTDVADITPRAATGFVRASGTGFTLNGKPFFFAGTNAYWATGLQSGDLNSLFSQMNSAGLHVLRIFGWSDVVGSSSTALQTWSGSTNTPNANSFAKIMDPIVNAAVANNIRLVIPMIGNWGPSISLYIQQILGSSATHDTFYSNGNIVAAYKKYINFFVNRYKNSPGIFAWELMNEARCTGDDNRGASSACNTQMITNWAKEISSYIKSIDGNHMVTMGDEGWFTPADGFGNSYPYQGGEGIDWTTNLKISTLDYGTIHLYPAGWGQTTSWGNTWIAQHAQKAKALNKPVVLEEFGTPSSGRQAVVQGWLNSAQSNGFAGFQYWQFVSKFPSGYTSPDDGNGISTSEATFSTIKSVASSFNAKD